MGQHRHWESRPTRSTRGLHHTAEALSRKCHIALARSHKTTSFADHRSATSNSLLPQLPGTLYSLQESGNLLSREPAFHSHPFPLSTKLLRTSPLEADVHSFGRSRRKIRSDWPAELTSCCLRLCRPLPSGRPIPALGSRHSHAHRAA